MPSLPSPELLVESLQLLAYLAVATVLSVAGAATEYASYQHVAAGDTTVALWMAAIGAVMLYAGAYAMGYRTLLERAVEFST